MHFSSVVSGTLARLLLMFANRFGADMPPMVNFSIICLDSGNHQETFSIKYVEMATEHAVRQARKVHGVNFTVSYGSADPSYPCNIYPVPGIVGKLSSMIQEVQPTFIIAPSCSSDFDAVAQLSLYYDIMTFTAWAPLSSMPATSVVLNRISLSGSYLGMFQTIIQMSLAYTWTNITVIYYQNDPYFTEPVDDRPNFVWDQLSQTFHSLLRNMGGHSPINIHLYSFSHTRNGTYEDVQANLLKASKHSRIFVFLMGVDLLRAYLIQADGLGYTNGDYAFFTLDPFDDTLIKNASVCVTGTLDGDDNNAAAMRGCGILMAVGVWLNVSDPLMPKFRGEITALANEARRDGNVLGSLTDHFDIIMIMGRLVRKVIDNGGTFENTLASITKISSSITNQYITHDEYGISSSGYYVDAQGERRARYSINRFSQINDSTFSFTEIASLDTATGVYTEVSDMRWSYNKRPVSYPPCGYMPSDDCTADLKNIIIAVAVTIPLVLGLGGLIAFYYRHYHKRHLSESLWIAYPDDLLVTNPDEEYLAKKVKHGGAINTYDMSMSMKDKDSMGVEDMGQSLRQSQGMSGGASNFRRRVVGARSDTGSWKRTMVTIRWCHKKQVPLSKKVLREVRQIFGLHHDNLAVFCGASLSKDYALVIYEYCSRGTLYELIERSEDKLEWAMRIAFLQDILNALLFLAGSTVGYHGRLTSECCHIDRRFLVKLSDFGLPSFFSHNHLELWVAKRNVKFLEGQLWQAPEVVQSKSEGSDRVKRGTELDVYSFGIILQEVILRSAPYSMYTDIDKDDLCTYLRVGKLIDGKPLRPFFSPDKLDNVDFGLVLLANSCWAENPQDRPKLPKIKETIKESALKMGIKESGSIMDMLLLQMDLQNTKLQAVVEEKGRHILREKEKADRIIAACLEKDFAEKLKHDQKISPEAFEIVTVLLSHICQFEHILVDSTPTQLIDVLNKYNYFIDNAITPFDCRKIDTEVDLITIASGVPKRNGILNAREVCRLALTLLYRELRFHHRPNDPVKLQMGVHSGPCVAAVVGKKLSRYTLFGETVDITKRMLVTGAAQKIHISSYTKDVLETFGSFKTEERGEVFVKGKGAMTTYWLTGEDGNKILKNLRTKYESILFAEDIGYA